MTAPALSSTLPSIEAFCRTYESGSFTRAARLLSLTPQAVSRSVARLEGAMGVTLFRRTTRSLAPTEEGRRYYELCVQALSLLAAGEQDLVRRRGAPEGRVRISVPTTYGHRRLLPSLGAFRERSPLPPGRSGIMCWRRRAARRPPHQRASPRCRAVTGRSASLRRAPGRG